MGGTTQNQFAQASLSLASGEPLSTPILPSSAGHRPQAAVGRQGGVGVGDSGPGSETQVCGQKEAEPDDHCPHMPGLAQLPSPAAPPGQPEWVQLTWPGLHPHSLQLLLT